MKIQDRDYPPLLRKISNPPKVLYCKGNLDYGGSPILAVVGTRRCSDYGKRVVIDFVSKLADAGFVIVSGLAKGIDALAHKTALENQAKTIAVLGSGIDDKSIYPRENLVLAKRIIEKDGAVISEYPEGTPPNHYHFPERNRIIAGLSLGVLVIEAKQRSGALITANHGFQQKKPIFTIPGSIYNPNSLGCHNLIKQGAVPVDSPNDILRYFKIAVAQGLPFKGGTKEERIVLEVLQEEALHIDQIIQSSKLNSASVITTLTKLEAEGKIKNLGGSVFAPNR